jgi:hypothetical protein
MGIRFYCPNGHKLNVKSFLAGKRGICPDCGAKVLIPVPDTGSGSADPEVPETPETPVAESETPTPSHEVPVSALPLASTGLIPGTEGVATGEEDHTPEVVVATDGPNDVQVGDPIDENPDAVWYVRLTSGNQYGPAVGDIFRGWIAEGRVTPDCLVWREGWPEWQRASAVFPQLIQQ